MRNASGRSRKASAKETVIEMVARRIEALVRSGELSRGSRLPSEPKLAAMLQVSRGSLREALKGLVFLGLLKARAGDGTYLQPSLTSMASRHLQWMLLLNEIRYLELYELRELLEPAAAGFAARRASREDLDIMRSALDGMKQSIHDPKAFIGHEMDFHGAITSASKNGALQSTMQMMYGALTEGRHRVLPLVSDLAEHCSRHERIFQLISQGDATGARRAVTADVKFAESLLRNSLKDLARDESTPHPIRTTFAKPEVVSKTASSQTPHSAKALPRLARRSASVPRVKSSSR